MTRLFLGCNQVSGYSHSRDLKYVGRLMKEYQTDERVMDTWQLAEEQGINTVLSDPFEKPVRLIKRYRKERGGKDPVDFRGPSPQVLLRNPPRGHKGDPEADPRQ